MKHLGFMEVFLFLRLKYDIYSVIIQNDKIQNYNLLYFGGNENG